MALSEAGRMSAARPVVYKKPSWCAVFVSNVLLLLMVFSPVWGVALGGWALWRAGKAVAQALPALHWRRSSPQVAPEVQQQVRAWPRHGEGVGEREPGQGMEF